VSNTTTLIVAPHPDDETFGCGGTILRSIREGADVHWLIATTMRGTGEYNEKQVSKRDRLIDSVAAAYGFADVHRLDFPASTLDTVGLKPLVQAIGTVMKQIEPNLVYAPFRHDVHSDHRVVFDAVVACSKWFRNPGIHRLLCYETLSETNFGIEPFHPTVFLDISTELPRKLEIAQLYADELGTHPFPRSLDSCQALALLRGSQSGYGAAEAFQLVRELG